MPTRRPTMNRPYTVSLFQYVWGEGFDVTGMVRESGVVMEATLAMAELIQCPCGDADCWAVLRGGEFYEQGAVRPGGGRLNDSLRRYAERQVREGASMVPASDDWNPCYPGGLVAVYFFAFLDGSGWCVSVWGADNTGMRRCFTSEEDARRCRQRLPVVLSKATLRDMGFKHE